MRGGLRWRSVRSDWFSALLPGGGPEWTGAGASVLMEERDLEHLPLGDRSLGSTAGDSGWLTPSSYQYQLLLPVSCQKQPFEPKLP